MMTANELEETGMRLYLIRHADPDYANDTLTADGRLEARALAKRLSREGLHTIYSSPMGRAVATMEEAAGHLAIKPIIEPWLAELNHQVELEGWGRLHVCDLPGEYVRSEGAHRHSDWAQREPYADAELQRKLETIRSESDMFLKRHGYERIGERYRILRSNEDRIAIFCHAALTMTWISHLLGIAPSLVWCGLWPAPSSVTTVLFEERSSEWAVPRCIAFGDTSHLYEAGLPISPRGIMGNYY